MASPVYEVKQQAHNEATVWDVVVHIRQFFLQLDTYRDPQSEAHRASKRQPCGY